MGDAGETPRRLDRPPRPWWMTAMAVFCLASAVLLIWRDFSLPHVRDVEVWFGFEVHDRAAMLTAPLHWGIFLAAAFGFWFQRPWIVPAAAGYSFYIALSHLIWNQTSPNGGGWPAGIAQTALFSVPGVLFLLALRNDRRAAGRTS